MVGVSVEAASDALIEKSRTVTTDGEGRYAIVDVRPGTYTVTFTMAGFATVKQQVEVPANITVTIDGNMKPGSVGETVNVEAAVATVDVQDVAHPEVLSRTDMDVLPTARNMQSIGSLVPGVHLNTPDVGGSMQVQQTYMTAHGNQSWHDTYLLDGLLINTTQLDGEIQTYVDNEIIQETTYQVSNATAEVEGGGVYVNMVPKDGGNQFHTEIFLGYVPSAFVGTNITGRETLRGVTGQSRVSEIQDFDGSFAGPVLKNKLWFLLTGRKQLSNLESAGSFNTNGTPGIETDYIYTGTARLTYQASTKNKISAMWQRDWKTIRDDIVSGAGGYNDSNPSLSSLHRDPVMYYILQTRWTGTITNKLILQGGFSLDKLDYYVTYQPGVQQVPFTPSWYANASELDTVALTRSVAGNVNSYYKFDRYAYNFTGQYVTGSHQIKFGYMDSFGPSYTNNIANGDAIYNYANGVPQNITAEDTPTYSKPYLDHDLAVYAMDTWNFKRLSITAGIRWEYLENHVNPETAPAGRFVPARSFSRIDCSTTPGLGCFKDWAPRLGVVYDLFGDHKTAIKAGVGKYDTPIVTSELNNFNPMFTTSETIPWVGAPATACQSGGNALSQLTTGTPGCYPLGTTFGTGNIGANPNPAFGLLPAVHTLDPNFHREYNLQYSAGVQRQVYRGTTINFAWNHRSDYQQVEVMNEAVPASAWTPQTITNPLSGQPITVFNLSPSYAGLTPLIHQTNAPQSLRANVYNGFETTVQARLPRRIFLFGGWTLDHEWDRSCDENANSSLLNDPNALRYCDWSGNPNLAVNGINVQSLGAISGVPYRNEFKVSGNMPIKWGIEASISLYDAPVYSTNFTTNIASANNITPAPAVFTGSQQGFYATNWTISSTTKYPADCNCPTPGQVVDPNLKQGSEVIPLVAPGSRLTPRLAQLDLTFRRVFHVKERMTISAEATMFNTLNQSVALTESESLGSSAKLYMTGSECTTVGNPANCGIGGIPSVISNPRMFRLSTQIKF